LLGTCWFGLGGFAGSTGLSAQGTIQGIVTTDRGQPIVGAEVVIEVLKLSTRTDRAGLFTLEVPAGSSVVLVRAVGFRPAVTSFVVADAKSIDVAIELERVPQALEPLVTTVPTEPVRGKMAGFEERRARGFGAFITRAQLAVREHSLLSDVLRMTGIPLIQRPRDCGGGFAAGSNRGFGGIRTEWMRCANGKPFPVGCYLTIYMDGIRMWTTGEVEPPNLDDYYVNGLEAVEVYRGASQIPVQYQTLNATCGAVLLWTRER
jgi:hypothetical protein